MNWKPWVSDSDGCLPCEEGQQYLFALQLASGSWDYCVDAVVWDSETPPAWSDGCHGWGLDDPQYYCDLECPDESALIALHERTWK